MLFPAYLQQLPVQWVHLHDSQLQQLSAAVITEKADNIRQEVNISALIFMGDSYISQIGKNKLRYYKNRWYLKDNQAFLLEVVSIKIETTSVKARRLAVLYSFRDQFLSLFVSYALMGYLQCQT
jgi:hypothetical protein